MFNDGYSINRRHYSELLERFDDANHVGSWNGVDQTPRYCELVDLNYFKNGTILEIGCGLGGFLEYCIERDIVSKGQYCGIDILQDIQIANERRFPQQRFMTRNVVEQPLSEEFDVVVLRGVFNIKMPDGKEYMEKLLSSAWSCCRHLLSFNFISSYVSFIDDEMEYHNPSEVMRYCIEQLSPRVIVNHHYWKCDTSCKVYR